MLEIIKSFHEGMCAEVRVGHDATDCFEVKNGLRQGCTMTPTLFNIYFNAMVCWCDECGEAEVTVVYKLGRKLVGDRTVKSKLHHMKITESQFADDVALYARTGSAFKTVGMNFVEVESQWRLTVGLAKTKGLAVGAETEEDGTVSVRVQGEVIDMVDEFIYFGSSNGEITTEVYRRIAKASQAFGHLRESTFRNNTLSVSTKRMVYRAVVLSTYFVVWS